MNDQPINSPAPRDPEDYIAALEARVSAISMEAQACWDLAAKRATILEEAAIKLARLERMLREHGKE